MKQPCFFGIAAHFCGMGSAKPICITPCPHGLERARSKVWSKGPSFDFATRAIRRVPHFPAAVNEISHIRREYNLTLREMRDRANLSCTQVGKKLFVDQSCVRHWEYGDWAPARKYYKKMAKLYGVSEEEIKAAAEAIRAANRGEKRDNQ